MTAAKEIKKDAFAKFAAKREEEQKAIERVGVFGQPEKEPEAKVKEVLVEEVVIDDLAEAIGDPADEDAAEDLPEKADVPKKKGRGPAKAKTAKADAGSVSHLTLNLPKDVIKGLKYMAIEQETSVSALVEGWYRRSR